MKHDQDMDPMHAKFRNFGPSQFDSIEAYLRGQEKKAMPAMMEKELISEAAQTQYRDGETQFLEWDIAPNPRLHPDNFYRGMALHYPVLYDPAWPVHIAHRRRENAHRKREKRKLGGEKKQKVPGSYALTGMTLSEAERHPIKKTLVFPHRNTELPFRQPPAADMRKPTISVCERLTLQEINEVETRIFLRSILENLSTYDKSNKEARIRALQKLLNIVPRPPDKAPPVIKKRALPRWRQKILDAKKKLEAKKVAKSAIVPEIIFVNDGPKCTVHGYSIPKHFCPIHNEEEAKEEDLIDKSKKASIVETVDDDEWCRMCSGRSLHRKVYGEDHSSYPTSPSKPVDKTKEDDKGKEEEVKPKGPMVWCPVCKGFDLHRKVYEWPPLEEEKKEGEDKEVDEGEWCPMCEGFNVHRKLYGEDYNDYPNPPYKDPTKDKNYKGKYCVWCKGYNVHREVYDWPSLG